MVISNELSEMAELPMRNYLCRNYDICLNKAAQANTVFGCEGCRKFVRAEKQELTSEELGGMLCLWGSVFESRISIH
ncbi:Uncharacterized protein dnm_080720 [Desulfonema magnum]|uniref:Uncharacterized protein n=1 Tax=Desulfonema magnum TaxID=45655 RepID=A0A975BUJ1_9BACT|nr:Uncharacterized protein dnm_080720 [Desulfonema magnum]